MLPNCHRGGFNKGRGGTVKGDAMRNELRQTRSKGVHPAGHFISRSRHRREFLKKLAALGTLLSVPRPLVSSTLLGEGAGQLGELTGRFIYVGTPPERKKLKVDKDVDCCGKYDIRDESLMVGPDGGLANVYVYLRSRGVPIPPGLAEKFPKRVTLDNRDCIFKPHCLAIWYTVQEFYIVNSDPIAQNVAFTPLGDLPANIILAPAPGEKTDATWRFHRSQTEPVHIVCNYHPWESAYILPRDNPYFAISGSDGTFHIPHLPPGEWEFQLWQERVRQFELPGYPRGRFTVTIKPGLNDLGTIRVSPASLGVT